MPSSRDLSPYRFLAIAAGIQALVDGIPEGSYPLSSWNDLQAAARKAIDLRLRGPQGVRLDASDFVAAIDSIAPRIGHVHFPVRDADDLAVKGGMVLVSLVLTHHQMQEPVQGERFTNLTERIEAVRPTNRENS